MLQEFTKWLIELVAQFFSDLWTFVQDAFVGIAGALADALAVVVNLIPVPAFMSGGLGQLYAGLDPGIAFVLGQVGLPAALAVMGIGYTFRLTRKFLTLFQW